MKKRFISGLLLAAGTASRFGRLKQVEELGGAPLVARAAAAIAESGVDELVVVLGFRAGEVLRQLGRKDFRVVVNPLFESGLSTSLRMGIQALDSRSEAALVCLADQPFVTADLLESMIRRFVHSRARVVAASSGDVVSPPMLLSRSLFERVLRLEGDKGAKSLAVSEPTLQRVEVEPAVLIDIDTEASLARARGLLRAKRRQSEERPGST